MRTYYSAHVYMHTEQMEFDKKEQAYIGYNPDTLQDHGLVNTLEGGLIEIIEALYVEYGNLDKLNAEAYDGRLEFSIEGEHHYNTPKAEQIPFAEFYSVVLTKVDETVLDAGILLKTKAVRGVK